MPEWIPAAVQAALDESVKPFKRKVTSLVASAQRIRAKRIEQRKWSATPGDWQKEAWDFYDEVGELRFIVNTLANRLSQARLYIGIQNKESQTDAPTEIDDPAIVQLLDDFGGSHAGRAQIIHRLGINLFVVGEAWLAELPKNRVQDELTLVDEVLLDDEREWQVFSIEEINTQFDGTVRVNMGNGEYIDLEPEEYTIARIWSPHPRRSWEADAATRSSLSILRELVGLTMHISAQVDSRLAGAGVFVIPQSAQRAMQLAAGIEEEDGGDEFTEALLEHMTTPILDRGSASAVVPMVVTVPDEVTDKFQHISFSTHLDAEARSLRDEAIRRLALGQDAPPEVLLGTSAMNHWGGWLVKEDVVSTHLEPPLALMCHAFTTEYLHPALIAQGMAEEEAQQYVIWYDVSHLVVRPNVATDAKTAHDAGVINDDALRYALGFDAGDAPKHTPESDPLPLEVSMALDMVKADPALITTPGLAVLVEQLQATLNGTPIEPPAAEPGPDVEVEVGSPLEPAPDVTQPVLPSEPQEAEIPEA